MANPRLTGFKGKVNLTDPGKQLRLGNVRAALDNDDVPNLGQVHELISLNFTFGTTAGTVLEGDNDALYAKLAGTQTFTGVKTFTTPVLGVATATSINGVTVSQNTLDRVGVGTNIQLGAGQNTIFGGSTKANAASLQNTYFGASLNSAGTAGNNHQLFGYNMVVSTGSVTGIGRNLTFSTATGAIVITPNSANTAHTITTNSSSPCVIIGDAITLNSNLSNCIGIGSVTLSDAQLQMTIIGAGAKGYLDATYGSNGSGQVAIGANSFSGSWRATAIGAYSQALAVSSNAIGYGSYTNAAHATVMGRGGYNDIGGAHLIYTGITGLGKTYFGAVAAKWTNPAMPLTEVVDISTGLNAGTVITKLFGIPGRDADAVPTLTNTRGGHLRITGGPSTGTALGGEFQIAVTPASGVSSNTENAEVVCASFDATAYSAGVVDTRFMLLDLSSGTLKRVLFGANDSGGAGYKYLKVAN